jgi:hypothetical protein
VAPTFSVALSIASFAMSTLALLAVAGLLRHIRRFGLADRSTEVQRCIRELAGQLVLVVDPACRSCKQRVDDVRLMDHTDRRGLMLLSAREGCESWTAGSDLPLLTDSSVVGRLSVTATPLLVRLDMDGMVTQRQLVGSRRDLVSALSK